MPTTETFNFTGAEQQFQVPPGLTSVYWELWGAGGADARSAGEDGGRVAGDLPVTGGETLPVYVGGAGANPSGGWNGGGDGAQISGSTATATAGGGGGATDVRKGGSALADREAIAAGGAGGADAASGGGDPLSTAVGGQGGPDTGEEGGDVTVDSSTIDGGDGGTQSAGGAGGTAPFGDGGDGSLGTGGDGRGEENVDNPAAGGGGGAGKYGGGGGTARSTASESGASGGGGGSNLDDGFSSVDANERGTGNSGDGQAQVTYDDNNPENLSGSRASVTSIELDWDPPSSADVATPVQYNIYRATSPGVTTGDTLAGSTADGTTTTFTDSGLSERTEYYYIVVADFTNGGEGDASNEVSEQTSVFAPTNLTEVSHDATSVEVTWDDESDGEDGYRLYASTDGGETYTQIGGDLSANSTTGTFTGLRNGEQYALQVRAFAGSIESGGDILILADDLEAVTETSPTRTVFSTAIRGSYTTQEP